MWWIRKYWPRYSKYWISVVLVPSKVLIAVRRTRVVSLDYCQWSIFKKFARQFLAVWWTSHGIRKKKKEEEKKGGEMSAVAIGGNSWPMRSFLVPTENRPLPARDQEILRRYRLKISNEPKTWREHCHHRFYPNAFDSFAFMVTEISVSESFRVKEEEALKYREDIKEIFSRHCDSIFILFFLITCFTFFVHYIHLTIYYSRFITDAAILNSLFIVSSFFFFLSFIQVIIHFKEYL